MQGWLAGWLLEGEAWPWNRVSCGFTRWRRAIGIGRRYKHPPVPNATLRPSQQTESHDYLQQKSLRLASQPANTCPREASDIPDFLSAAGDFIPFFFSRPRLLLVAASFSRSRCPLVGNRSWKLPSFRSALDPRDFEPNSTNIARFNHGTINTSSW